jgi:regulatory protein
MEEQAREIKKICMSLLARRDHCKKELLAKVSAKGFDAELSRSVLDSLGREGWLDDSRYAESYARSRILKGYGPARIAHELHQQGIEADSGAGAFINLDDVARTEAGGWLEVLEQVYRKKYRQEKRMTFDEWAKRSRFLRQRGFTASMIKVLQQQLNIKLINT